MTSTKLLARNTALNLIGQVLPLGVAVVAVPILIRALGEGRFGILTLAWALIGYFALLDFGLGRALTQAASEAIGQGDAERLRELSVVSIVSMLVIGVLGAVVVAAATPWLAYAFLKMDGALRSEAATSFYLLAASLPFVLGTIGFRGLLEAHQHFGLATALRLPYAIFNFVGPLAVIPFSHSLVPIVGMLVVGRVLMFAAHFIVSLRQYPWLRDKSPRSMATLAPLLRLGGWMMVSNVVSPMMVYLDRFVIGALISVTAVAYYVTPFELVTKLLIVPAAVVGVFFPAFAAMFTSNRPRTALLFDRATRFVLIVVFPATLLLVAFAHEVLLAWVGPEFAQRSAVAMQLLAAGVLINSFAQAPFALLQATRRADLTAKLHLAELPVYALMIVVLGRRFGVAGVALAWTLRVSIDTLLLSWLTRRQLPEIVSALDRSLVWLGVMTAILFGVQMADSVVVRAIVASVVLVVFSAAAWLALLTPTERGVVIGVMRQRQRREAAEGGV